MLVIRLLRAGKKNQPFFRVVVTEKSKAPKGGGFIEKLGYVNPLTKENSLNEERIKYWIEKGAQCSDRVHNLLVDKGVFEKEKIAVHSKKKGEGKEEVKEDKPSGEEKKEETPKEEKKEETPKEEKKDDVEEEKKEEQRVEDKSEKPEEEKLEEKEEEAPQEKEEEKKEEPKEEEKKEESSDENKEEK